MGRYRIVYEDEWLIVIDKPSGMLVIPTPKEETNTLTNLLNNYLDRCGIEVNAYPCHRLDRETSGLIIYAKGKSVQRLVMDQFKNRTVNKIYTAYVEGTIKDNLGTIKIPIYNINKKRREPAITKYRVIERKGGFTILDLEPLTGRTNQIRIHLKSIGHPILGERVYAFRKDFKIKFKRLALHAGSLEFSHPVTREKLNFKAPLPEDMEKFKNYAAYSG